MKKEILALWASVTFAPMLYQPESTMSTETAVINSSSTIDIMMISAGIVFFVMLLVLFRQQLLFLPILSHTLLRWSKTQKHNYDNTAVGFLSRIYGYVIMKVGWLRTFPI